MMNELLFFAHCFIAMGSVVFALKLGRQALISLFVVYCLLSNIFIVKQIDLFGFHATAADIFTVGATLIITLLQEYYGSQITKKAIFTSLFVSVVYIIFSQFHLWYQPNIFDTNHNHFVALFSLAPRIVVSSLFVYWLTQHCACFCSSFLQSTSLKKYFLVRTYAVLFLTQLIDTVLFSCLALFGVVENIWSIIFVSYSVKVVVTIFAVFFVNILKNKINID